MYSKKCSEVQEQYVNKAGKSMQESEDLELSCGIWDYPCLLDSNQDFQDYTE